MPKINSDEVLSMIRKSIRSGRQKFEDRRPELEKYLLEYVRKKGLKPEDINGLREKIKEKIRNISQKV